MPRRLWYPVAGAVLAVGSPLGLLLLRFLAAVESRPPLLPFIEREVFSDRLLYGYLSGSTLAVFLLLGFLLGRKEDALATDATTDPLTGLSNRLYFQRRLDEELSRSTRHGLSFALMLIDIDEFKQLNDRSGHAAGDAALCRIGAGLRKGCRAFDVAARYGGDEFAVLAPATGASDAVALAERLRASASDPTGPSLSIGVAVRTIEENAASLLASADRALYEAKRLGRNRVVLAAPGGGSDPATP